MTAVDPPPAPPAARTSARRGPGAGKGPAMKKTILIADDDEAVLTMLGRFLESENYNVVFARNGVQALAEFLDQLAFTFADFGQTA